MAQLRATGLATWSGGGGETSAGGMTGEGGGSAAADSAFSRVWPTSVTGASNRYPRLGMVAMYWRPSGCSPSVFRSREMLTVRLISSTKLSGQIACISSSRVNNWPWRETSATNKSNDFGASGIGVCPRRRRCSPGHKPYGPKLYDLPLTWL